MFILTQFVLRASFGLAAAMAITPPRQVTSGYYRNHLYVLLGLNVLATLVAWSYPDALPVAPPLIAAVLSYIGAVFWLYEKPRAGISILWSIAAVCLWGALAAFPDLGGSRHPGALYVAATVTSGLLLGVTLAAMFLGHWYLNSPGMAIAPLERLVLILGACAVLRAAVSGVGLAMQLMVDEPLRADVLLFVFLRWIAGLLGPLVLAWMTWRTLKVPNTQSATGILYVAVIVTFIGELTSLLLTSQLRYPI